MTNNWAMFMKKFFSANLLLLAMVLGIVGCSGKGYIKQTQVHQTTTKIDNLLVFSKVSAYDVNFGDGISKFFDTRIEELLASKGVRTKIVMVPTKLQLEGLDIEKTVRESDFDFVMFVKFDKFDVMQFQYATSIMTDLTVTVYDRRKDKLIWTGNIIWGRGSHLFTTSNAAGTGLADTVFDSMQRDLVLGK